MNNEIKQYTIALRAKAHSAINASSTVTIAADHFGKIISVCDAAKKCFGFSPHELYGQPLRSLIASTEYSSFSRDSIDALEIGSSHDITLKHRDGYFFTGTITLCSVEHSDEGLLQTAIKNLSQNPGQLRQNELLEQHGKIGSWWMNADDRSIQISAGIYQIFGLDNGIAITPEHLLYYFQDYQNRVQAVFRKGLREQKAFTLDAQIINNRQQTVWLRIKGQPEYRNQTSQPQLSGLQGTIQDISSLKALQFTHAYLNANIKSILEALDHPVFILDTQGRLAKINSSASRVFRELFNADLTPGRQFAESLSDYPNDRRIYKCLFEIAAKRSQYSVEMPLAQRTDLLPFYHLKFDRILDHDDHFLGLSCQAIPTQTDNKTQLQNNYLATHDALSGLLNKKAFLHQIRRAISSAGQHQSEHFLLYVNFPLDNEFAGKNDPDAIDAFIRQCTALLQNRFRGRDPLARVSQDEFGAILEHCNQSRAVKVAHLLHEDVCKSEIHWQGKTLPMKCHIGLVEIKSQPDNPEHLLNLAENTCHGAQNHINVYRPPTEKDDKRPNSDDSQAFYIELLKSALTQDEALKLDYQLIQPMNVAEWGEHFEVLARIVDPDKNLVMPREFMPIAERYDICRELDQKIIAKTIAWLASNQGSSHRHKLCSINLSLDSLLHPKELSNHIQHCLCNDNIAPGTLCFEAQESFLSQHQNQVSECLHLLKSHGYKVAIDRVGSAGLDFRYLGALDLDFIKIDGSLTANLRDNRLNRLALEYLMQLADATQTRTIALNIENKFTYSTVVQMGLHYGQGYCIAQPKPLSSLSA